MPHKSVPQACPTRVSYESASQERHTRVSHKSVPQECPTRVFRKSVLQECSARVPRKIECHTNVSHKIDKQECPTRVSRKSVPQECPTRVSYKSVPQKCLVQDCQKLFGCLFSSTRLHSGSWAPSCFSFCIYTASSIAKKHKVIKYAVVCSASLSNMSKTIENSAETLFVFGLL